MAEIKPVHSETEMTGDRYYQATFGESAVASDHKVVGVVVVCKDLTNIQFEAEVWKKVLDTGMSERPLVIVNQDGIITHCNDTGAEALQMIGSDGRPIADKAIGMAMKSLISIKSRDIIDEVISKVYESGNQLNMPLLSCDLVQRQKMLGRGATNLALKWLACAHFESMMGGTMTPGKEGGFVKGVIFQLQAFPMLALAVENTEGYPILQQNQFVQGIFEYDFAEYGIHVHEAIGEAALEELKVKLTESGTDHKMRADFAGATEDHILRWNLDASLRAEDQEVKEILLLLQILDVVHC